jgi:hypothetical protein
MQRLLREPIQPSRRHVLFQLSVPDFGVEGGEPVPQRSEVLRLQATNGLLNLVNGTHSDILTPRRASYNDPRNERTRSGTDRHGPFALLFCGRQSKNATFRIAFDWLSVFINTWCQPCSMIVA